MSQAAFSLFTSSQVNTPVSSKATLPVSAVAVMSILCQPDVIQKPHTVRNTQARIHSLPLIAPMAVSSREANAGASGVCRISGGYSLWISHGTASSEQSPGTIPATNQLAQVTGKPAFVAICAASGLLA